MYIITMPVSQANIKILLHLLLRYTADLSCESPLSDLGLSEGVFLISDRTLQGIEHPTNQSSLPLRAPPP